MIQDELKENFDEVKSEFENYVDKRTDLLKLHIVNELSHFTAGFAVKMGILYLFFFVLMFLSLALAFFLGEMLHSTGWGFTIVAGIYLLLAVIFFLMRGIIVHRPVIRSFINLFFPKFDTNEEA